MRVFHEVRGGGHEVVGLVHEDHLVAEGVLAVPEDLEEGVARLPAVHLARGAPRDGVPEFAAMLRV